MPNGETAYTRAGSFQTNQDGQIVTPDGYTVLPGITVPAGTLNITINESGQVFAQIDGQIQEQNVGQFQLATFQTPAGLETVGNTMLQIGRASCRERVWKEV